MKFPLTLLSVGLCLTAVSAAQSQFVERPEVGGASSFTPDTSTVVGSDGQGAWYWTQAGGLVSIGGSQGTEVSADGSVVAGNRVGVSGFDGPAVWTQAGGWVDLGGLPGQSPPSNSHGTTYDMSADGSAVVGLGWRSDWKARGFRWDSTSQQVTELPQMGSRSSRATAISGDGQWIGGFDEHDNGTRRAALWDSALVETLFLARPANPNGYGEILDINSDGSVIVGNENGGGYRWTPGDGFVNFGQVPGVDPVQNYNWAGRTSEDGSVVVGGNWDLWQGTTFATIWTEQSGILFLSDYLTGLGVSGLDNYQLANVIDISADGGTILGWGVRYQPFGFVTWEASVPVGCNGGTASFCVTSPNSVGAGALLTSNNQVSVAANALELRAGPVPDQFGIFFYGSSTQAPAALGNGSLCLTGKLVRLPVVQASNGVLVIQPDMTAGWNSGLLPGTTWHFQAWYRDPAGGGAGHNLSDGLSVTFCD